jgi:AhpD family alkylhydroperoxidase
MAKNETAKEKMTPDTTDETGRALSLNREGKRKSPVSMSMIEPRFRNIYKSFYKETYFTPTTLDLKTKELIAIGVSLVAKCEGCLQGHIKKALEIGLTKAEISDAIVIAVGIAAAGVVDLSDRTATKLDLHHFE